MLIVRDTKQLDKYWKIGYYIDMESKPSCAGWRAFQPSHESLGGAFGIPERMLPIRRQIFREIPQQGA